MIDQGVVQESVRAALQQLGIQTLGAAPPLAEIRAQFETYKRGRVHPRHLFWCLRQIDILIERTGAKTVADLTPDGVSAILSQLSEDGAADKTVNDHLIAIRTMLNWAVKRRVIPHNPLSAVEKRRVRPVRRRRALPHDDLEKLLAAAVPAAIHRAIEMAGGEARLTRKLLSGAYYRGERNAVIYRISAYTGIRKGELKTLRWADIDWEKRTIHLRAETTKNRKDDTLPMHPALFAHLEVWRRLHGGDPASPVVRVPIRMDEILRADLQFARIPAVDGKGEVVDFHSLRHTFLTWIRRYAKGDPALYMAAGRHSALTTSLRYQHVEEEELRAAVEKLPAVDGRFHGEFQGILWTDTIFSKKAVDSATALATIK